MIYSFFIIIDFNSFKVGLIGKNLNLILLLNSEAIFSLRHIANLPALIDLNLHY